MVIQCRYSFRVLLFIICLQVTGCGTASQKYYILAEDLAKRIFDDVVKLGDTSNMASQDLVNGLRSQFDNLKATRKGLIRMRASGSITNAEYIEEVKSGIFPDSEYIYSIKAEELSELENSEQWMKD